MLFNRDNNGSEELYRITGTFKASTDYTSIANDIEDATEDLRSLVGPIVARAEDTYENGESSEVLTLVQRAVAARALCYFAKNTGLSHGETGRKLKVDENEKIPFEWMVDRDDRNLNERYYRAIDRLFRYLYSSDEIDINDLPDGDIHRLLFIKNINDFEAVYPISGSYYTFNALIPLMSEAQDHLIGMLGLTSGEKLPQIYATSKYIVLSALESALRRWSLSIFPLEISRQFAPSYQGNKENRVATKEEIERSIRNFRADARQAYTDIVFHLKGECPVTDILPENSTENKFFTV